MKTRIAAILLTLFMIMPMAVPVQASSSLPEEYFEIADGIIAAAKAFEPSYPIPEGYTIFEDDIVSVMSMVYNMDPYLFYVSLKYNYSYVQNEAGQRRIVSLNLKYNMTKDEYTASLAEVEEWASKVISLADPSFTELEYALFFHDYLCNNYEYDSDLASRTVYSFIKTGKGVCQSYTYAYMLLLGKVGVESSFASSREMNHVWNLVKIDGKWYHVDVTWDDPVGGVPGVALHKYFLLSDDEFYEEKGHYGWVSLYDCTSAKYDGNTFSASETSYAHHGDKWYYVKDGNLYSVNTLGMTGTVAMELDMVWNVWDSSSYYTNSYSSIVSSGGWLYISTPTGVVKIDPVSGTLKNVCGYSGQDGYIYGFVLDMGIDGVSGAGFNAGCVKLHITDHPNKAGRFENVTLSITSDSVKGDSNGNGTVNLADVTLSLKYIAKWRVFIDFAADFDESGSVNLADVTLALKRIAGWTV